MNKILSHSGKFKMESLHLKLHLTIANFHFCLQARVSYLNVLQWAHLNVAEESLWIFRCLAQSV